MVAFCALSKRWVDGGGADIMVILSIAIAARMNRLAIRVRLFHNIVYLSASCCAATMGQRDSAL